MLKLFPPIVDFNPRPPRGGRRATLHRQHRLAIGFQSTPPARGGDVKKDYPDAFIKISIHAPREGGDNTDKRERLVTDISIHAPREGGDALLLVFSST